MRQWASLLLKPSNSFHGSSQAPKAPSTDPSPQPETARWAARPRGRRHIDTCGRRCYDLPPQHQVGGRRSAATEPPAYGRRHATKPVAHEVGRLPKTLAKAAERQTQPLPRVFARYRPQIDDALRESLRAQTSSAYSLLHYSMGWADASGRPDDGAAGKALRPTLCLFSCEASGGNVGTAIPAAVALELIHNFSLIHDDIQDRDRVRHHRPTVWAVWGESKALIAGNALRAIADAALERLDNVGVGLSQALEVTGLLTEACLEMIEGQYLDLAFEERADIGTQEYLAMISRKTGSLIRCAMNVGAIIGSSDRLVSDSFREAGRALGLVFQVRDDLLGVWGDPSATGKPVGADIMRKKKSFPVVYAMAQASTEERRLLADIYASDRLGERDVAVVLEVMDRTGVREYAEDLAAEHCEIALERLSNVEMSRESRREVEEIARFLLVREH